MSKGRTLICKICKKEIKVNRYECDSDEDYTCAFCRAGEFVTAPRK